MKIEASRKPSEIMHVDLNSAFAMTEQQANPLLRGKPVGITNRLNDWAICITASYEAKRQGIGIGTRWREARQKSHNFVMLESDPAKYTYVHAQLKRIFASYSPVAFMKSIDEGIIDFRGLSKLQKNRPLTDIAQEIKRRVKEEVGDYMTVNIGIAQNRWLAKLAAGFLKPDGLYVIDRDNLEVIYGLIQLEELPYIKSKMRQRLNSANIFTPLEFYRAPESTLVKQVFRSINGHHWYLKLRGYETEVEFRVRTIGRSYVLEHRTADPKELAALLYKAAVKLSRRLARTGVAARGVMVGLGYAVSQHQEGPYGWYQRQMYASPVSRADQLFGRMMDLFGCSPPHREVSSLSVTCYGLERRYIEQLSLLEDDYSRRERLEGAINSLNDRYGELTVIPAILATSSNPMKDKIPFGGIRYLD
jgi:DNA polymerase IV